MADIFFWIPIRNADVLLGWKYRRLPGVPELVPTMGHSCGICKMGDGEENQRQKVDQMGDGGETAGSPMVFRPGCIEID